MCAKPRRTGSAPACGDPPHGLKAGHPFRVAHGPVGDIVDRIKTGCGEPPAPQLRRQWIRRNHGSHAVGPRGHACPSGPQQAYRAESAQGFATVLSETFRFDVAVSTRVK